MRKISLAFLLALPIVLISRAPVAAQSAKPAITWKKTVVDKTFRSEGVAVADVNKDGKADIIVGDVWYEAPDWKMHPLRKERVKNHTWDPKNYSECFGVFADDFNGDGFPDAIVIPFPGKACYWYENPKDTSKLWKEHLLTTSACNETPIFVDLFGTGKNVLVMAWQPDNMNNMGEMCYFLPGKDPTKPWTRHSISGPSQKGKEVPATQRFSHGLGHGDVNGDGKIDVLCPAGWWEQPAKLGDEPWKFHATGIGQNCADMYAFDVDGDGKNDVVSTSAHGYGFWWHQQKSGAKGPIFLTQDFFQAPPVLAKVPSEIKLTKDEAGLYASINRLREQQKRAPWRADAKLCEQARRGIPIQGLVFQGKSAEAALKALQEHADFAKGMSPNMKVGVGEADGKFTIVLSQLGVFSLPGQTHALHLVDVDGDGLKDLVTGRRYWAHGPNGDVSPADPAYLYWFKAKKNKDGTITFTPNLVDDDSGIATQFAVADINGDGILDIIISNKRGVFVFEQVRPDMKKD